MYDIYYISNEKTKYFHQLKEKYPLIKHALSFRDAQDRCLTEFFWIIWDDLIVEENFCFDYVPDNWSKQYIHQFLNESFYDGIILCPKSQYIADKEISHRFFINKKQVDIVASTPKPYDQFEIDSYEEYLSALETSTTEMFWIIPSYVTVSKSFQFDTYFSHDQTYERSINHVYLNGKFHDGVVLCSKKSKFSKREFDYRFIAHKKEWPVIVSMPKPYDIVFISYREPNADQNYDILTKRFPQAKRVHGVKGIHQAHIAAAKLCTTDMFWVVDGDALLTNDFEFDYQVARWNHDTVHVWRSRNPINDLVYGYGGVKLLPTKLTLNVDITTSDMTTSISKKFKVVDQISNITAFNTDPFNTWKSAFRECVKLSSNSINRCESEETMERLFMWKLVGSGRTYGDYSIAGAKAGEEYGVKYRNNPYALAKINDFDWLYNLFKEQFKKK